MNKLKGLQNLGESLLNSSPIGLYIVQDGRFKVVSVQFTRICGYSEDELVGRHSLELVLPEDRDAVRENAIMSLKGESSEGYEFRIATKTGEPRTIFETIAPIQYLDKRAVLGNFMDITERKQAEEALRESEERFAKVFRTSPDAITIVAVDDSRIIDVNEGFTRFTGRTREEAIGKTPVELDLWARPEEHYRMVSLLKKNTRFFNEEFACRTKSGEMRVGLFSTEVINIDGRQCRMSVIKDITERKRLEEEQARLIKELQESLAKVNTLSGLLPICAWCKKLRDDEGYWKSVEDYVSEHTGAEFTHGMCPDCQSKYLTEDSPHEK